MEGIEEMSNDTSEETRKIFLNRLSPRCGVLLAAGFAEIIADGLITDQIGALGSFVTTIGDNLSLIADQLDSTAKRFSKAVVDDRPREADDRIFRTL